jgi:hypothetical protein
MWVVMMVNLKDDAMEKSLVLSWEKNLVALLVLQLVGL